MKKNEALKRFLEEQQNVVARFLGIKYISSYQFSLDIDMPWEKAVKVLERGAVPGAQMVQFKDRRRWIVPSNHGYKKKKTCRARLFISKAGFERLLNETVKDKKVRVGLGERTLTCYGSWLKKKKPEEFQLKYDQYVEENQAQKLERVKKPKHPGSSNETLFPL